MKIKLGYKDNRPRILEFEGTMEECEKLMAMQSLELEGYEE